MTLVKSSLVALAAAAALGAAGYGMAQTAPAPAASATAADLKPGAYKADPSHTKITWAVDHMGNSTYLGQFVDVEADLVIAANPAASTLSVTVPLTRMVSGNAGLDKHMSTPDFFDVPNFGTATFKSTKIALTGPNTGAVTGDLTIRGVTKPVVLDVIFRKGALNARTNKYALGFDAMTVIKRSDFGVKYGVPMVSDMVPLRIGAEFREQ